VHYETERVGDDPAEFLVKIECTDPETSKCLTLFLSAEDAAALWADLDYIRRGDTGQRFAEALHKKGS
jgi:hypothetical protein